MQRKWRKGGRFSRSVRRQLGWYMMVEVATYSCPAFHLYIFLSSFSSLSPDDTQFSIRLFNTAPLPVGGSVMLSHRTHIE